MKRLMETYSEKQVISALLLSGAVAFSVGLLFLVPELLAGIILTASVFYAAWIRHQRLLNDLAREKADIRKAETAARFVSVVSKQGVLAYDADTGLASFFTRETQRRGEIGGTGSTQGGNQTPLNVALGRFDRVLVIGGMGTGKSELLKWLAYDRSLQGEVVIIDAHASPATWPCGRTAGIGRDYPAIEREINRILAEMNRRYERYASGTATDFPQLAVVIDEMTVTNQFAEVSEQLKSLLCECRKVNIKLISAGQSDRAGAIGLRGNYDLITGYEAICYLEKDPATGEYYGTVKTPGNGPDQRYYHPGMFNLSQCHGDPSRCHGVTRPENAPVTPKNNNRDSVTELAFDPENGAWAADNAPVSRRIFESHEERTIVTMFEAGETLNRIARELWGASNGRRTAYLKRVLENHNLI